MKANIFQMKTLPVIDKVNYHSRTIYCSTGISKKTANLQYRRKKGFPVIFHSATRRKICDPNHPDFNIIDYDTYFSIN